MLKTYGSFKIVNTSKVSTRTLNQLKKLIQKRIIEGGGSPQNMLESIRILGDLPVGKNLIKIYLLHVYYADEVGEIGNECFNKGYEAGKIDNKCGCKIG